MMILSPSLLGADFKHLEEEIARIERGGAKYLHLDVMDGAFVQAFLLVCRCFLLSEAVPILYLMCI